MANINQTKLAAEKVLKEIKEKKGKIIYPINPFELLKEQNAIITYSDFDKLEGLLLYDKEKSVVAINMNRPIKRQRFTAAHELGHILLHTEVKANSFLCPIAGKKNDIEKEADSFASYLLMPTDELEKMVDLYQDEEGKVGLDECLLISEYFGVSFESCVKTICFRIRRFQEELDNNELTKLIKKYKPNSKRKEMLNKTNDLSLLVNAINYSYENTTIQIKLEEKEGKISIVFRNKGDKIPQYKLDKLFEKFYRGDDARTSSTGGAGLGLAITKQIIELHEGKIYVKNDDEYIEFFIEL